jgi:hypothetical protein
MASWGGQRSRRKLRQGQAVLIVCFGDPVALLDEIAMHISDQGNGTTKTERAELQCVENNLSK